MLLNDGRTAGYGLGLMVSDHRGVEVLHHAGGVMGGVCMCLTIEALGLDVIIISNRNDTPVESAVGDQTATSREPAVSPRGRRGGA